MRLLHDDDDQHRDGLLSRRSLQLMALVHIVSIHAASAASLGAWLVLQDAAADPIVRASLSFGAAAFAGMVTFYRLGIRLSRIQR